LRHRLEVGARSKVIDQHHELVAAEARHRVGCTVPCDGIRLARQPAQPPPKISAADAPKAPAM